MSRSTFANWIFKVPSPSDNKTLTVLFLNIMYVSSLLMLMLFLMKLSKIMHFVIIYCCMKTGNRTNIFITFKKTNINILYMKRDILCTCSGSNVVTFFLVMSSMRKDHPIEWLNESHMNCHVIFTAYHVQSINLWFWSL